MPVKCITGCINQDEKYWLIFCIFVPVLLFLGSYGFDSECDFYVSMSCVVNMAR